LTTNFAVCGIATLGGPNNGNSCAKDRGLSRLVISLDRLRPLAGALPAALLVLSLAPAEARAEDATPNPALNEIEKKLETRRGELENAEDREKALKSDVSEILSEREKLNAVLVETAGLVQKSEARMTAIEARLAELEGQEKQVRGSLNERYDHIAKLLSALQRMGRNPPPVMITRREDALKMVRSAMLLAAAFPSMRDEARTLADQLKELTRLMTEKRTESERLKAETDQLNEKRQRLAGLLETKKQSLAEHQVELEQVRRAAAEISKSVNDLNELIAKVDQEVSTKTALATYEEETKRSLGATSDGMAEGAAGAPDSKTKPTELAALSPPPSPSAPGSAVVELAPAGTSLVPGSPGRIKPSIEFSLAKARLPLPAQGRRVLTFGSKTQYGGTSKGLVIETRPSAQVTSPCDGWIVYAGEFRSYGQLLIINAGGGYHVLVAGLSQIDVQPGQFVLAAEPVGTMGGPPKAAQGGAQMSAPVLYVEFRKDGHPIDPDPWWAENHQKVQG
jgi:septal ring factor EnvC (AmiA/AmiB activator)